MLLVELAYEMDAGDQDFHDNLALMLHFGILGMDHPFKSLGEHCKRLLMNLIHSIYFRDNDVPSHLYPDVQELMVFLVRKRGKLMWQREIINETQLEIASTAQLQILVQWLVRVLHNKHPDVDLAQKWSHSAIFWFKNCTSTFTASRALQIYRSLRMFHESKFDKDLFYIMIQYFKSPEKIDLWCDMLLLVKEWSGCIKRAAADESEEEQLWQDMFWICIEMCYQDPASYPHVFAHPLSLLSSILQYLPTSSEMWDNLLHNIPENIAKLGFDGVQNIALKGLLSVNTRAQCEEFLSSLMSMQIHPIIGGLSTCIHKCIISQLPSICVFLSVNNNTSIEDEQELRTINDLNIVNQEHDQHHISSLASAISGYFYSIGMEKLSRLFRICVIDSSGCYDVDLFLSHLLPLLTKQWINPIKYADIHCIKVLLDLLDTISNKNNNHHLVYKKQVLSLLYGILRWIEWDKSSICMEMDSAFFDKVTDLLPTPLWHEATNILEVVVKFNNNSNKAPSELFVPQVPMALYDSDSCEPAIEEALDSQSALISPSKRKKNTRISLDPTSIAADGHNTDDIEIQKFQPSLAAKDIPPPFSPRQLGIGGKLATIKFKRGSRQSSRSSLLASKEKHQHILQHIAQQWRNDIADENECKNANQNENTNVSAVNVEQNIEEKPEIVESDIETSHQQATSTNHSSPKEQENIENIGMTVNYIAL